MNKKKSRKNKKRRDNDTHKPVHHKLNQSPNTYLDNFNLSQQQQSAIKFLSEALAISSQEAHIICNECKWEQSEFPSNLEAAQTMLHWNKKNTKSKTKREQNKYKQVKQQLPKHTHDKSTKKSMKNHTHSSPHHSPNKSPSKQSHNHNHSNANSNHNKSPKFGGFVPHMHRMQGNNKVLTPNKRHGHVHIRDNNESTPKNNKNNKKNTQKKDKNMANNNGGGNRVLLTVSSSRALPPNQNVGVNNMNQRNVSNRRSLSPPNITAEMGLPHQNAKSIQFLNRAYTSSRGRSRGTSRYISRVPPSHGRGRGRGIISRNINNKYIKSNYASPPQIKNTNPNPNLSARRVPHPVPDSPQSSSESAQANHQNHNHNHVEANNNNNMYVHETLEQELRREQQVNAIKLPKEFEKDLDSNLSQIFEVPLPPQVPPPEMNGHILIKNNDENVPGVVNIKDIKQEQVPHEVEEELRVDNKHNASMQISPKNMSMSPQKMPSPMKLMTQQSFLSSMDEDHTDEFKEQSFMFINSTQDTQVQVQQVVGNSDSGHAGRHDATVTDRKEALLSQDEVREEVDESVDNSSMSFGEKYSELFQILDGTLVIGHCSGNLAPHLCMTFDTLLDLANYQNGEILRLNDLMEWYKISKNKLVYNKDIEMFNNESTQHLFDEFQARERMKMKHTIKNNIINVNEEQKQYETNTNTNPNTNSNVKMNKKQREKERKPTRPPMSAKYNHFISKNMEKTNNNNSNPNSKSVPNQNKILNPNLNSNSRRERVISQTQTKTQNKTKNSSKPRLNSNAKTFEPKSRSSSRTKSIKSVHNTNSNKSNTPVLSLQPAKSITPQIQQPILHIPMPQPQPQTQVQVQVQAQPQAISAAKSMQQNSSVLNGISNINGIHQSTNINLTNSNSLNHHQNQNQNQRPKVTQVAPQTVTIRSDPYVTNVQHNVQQIQQVQSIAQQPYLMPNSMNTMNNNINTMNHSHSHSHNAHTQAQISMNNINNKININKLNALQRVNSLPLSHQSSNGSLGGNNSIEFVQRFTNNNNNISCNAEGHNHGHNQVSQHNQHNHGLINNYQQRLQAQRQQQQLISHSQQAPASLQPPPPLHPPPQHRFTNQTVYKQVPTQAQTQTQFISPGASISPRMQQQQQQQQQPQFIIKSSNNNHYIVDNHQQILQRIQQNHPILQ